MTLADLVADLRNGRLEQACPECGIWEAAGTHCSACLRPMGESDWYTNGDLERRKAAQRASENRQPRSKRGRGRPRASERTAALAPAPEPVAARAEEQLALPVT